MWIRNVEKKRKTILENTCAYHFGGSEKASDRFPKISKKHKIFQRLIAFLLDTGLLEFRQHNGRLEFRPAIPPRPAPARRRRRRPAARAVPPRSTRCPNLSVIKFHTNPAFLSYTRIQSPVPSENPFFVGYLGHTPGFVFGFRGAEINLRFCALRTKFHSFGTGFNVSACVVGLVSESFVRVRSGHLVQTGLDPTEGLWEDPSTTGRFYGDSSCFSSYSLKKFALQLGKITLVDCKYHIPVDSWISLERSTWDKFADRFRAILVRNSIRSCRDFELWNTRT